ncbi:MAG: hypothetical protein JWM68_4143 [Verrucomicrobiales bacterium]|nr:hypothetical protein [Verrucomicrobiales bacterium]
MHAEIINMKNIGADQNDGGADCDEDAAKKQRSDSGHATLRAAPFQLT